MADKRISQLIERTDIANNDVLPIVASGATTTNKVTISTIQDWMQDNLDVGVTSVGLSMPSAFVVSNSPVTASGNITVTGAGTVSQYIRGDGSLADFPQSGGGGGASVNYYLNGSVSQGTIGGIAYYEMNRTPILGAGTNFTIAADGYIASFITDAGNPGLLEIPGGNWNLETYFAASSGGGSPSFYVELYKVDSGGTATLVASNSANPELIAFGTTTTAYFSSLAVPTTVLTLTDRLALRYYVTHAGRTITMHTENSNLCQIITTFTTGLTALNGLTAQVQNFATGTTGTDFNISSSVSTHTFNIPSASATARGLVTTGSQTIAGSKNFSSDAIINGVNVGKGASSVATNTSLGFQSLTFNTTGSSNTSVGWSSLYLNTTGSANSSFGTLALENNTTGTGNTASGYAALRNNTTGGSNTATGYLALNANTTGNANTATGAYALENNTTGTDNTAVGQNALENNTTANGNTGIGLSALQYNTTGNQNAVLGAFSMQDNTTGSSNSAVGYNSLQKNTTGFANSALGLSSLNKNTTGYQNTATGVESLLKNTTGNNNTAIGNRSLYENTDGDENTAVGQNSLFSNTTGNQNTAIGFNAGALTNSGSNNTTSSNSVYIGQDTRVYASGNINEIVIGSSARGNGSNTVTIGNSSITDTYLRGAVRLSDTGTSSSIIITSDSTGSGAIHLTKNTSGTGIRITNNGVGEGIIALNNSTGSGITIGNISTGKGLIIDNAAAATGDPFVYTLGGAAFLKAKIDYLGNLTANSFIKTGGTSSQFLKADGSVDSSTYLTTSSAASTYLPLTGGILTGGIALTSGNLEIAAGNGAILFNPANSQYFQLYTNSSNELNFGYGGTSPVVAKIGSSGAVTLTGALNGTSASFTGGVTSTGSKSQFVANGGDSAGAGISLNTTLTTNPTLRRNWGIFTEDQIEGDFAIKCSTAAGGNANTGNRHFFMTSTGAATFSSSVAANGVMSLGNDGTFGSTYKTLGLTGNTTGSHRIFAGTADDMYFAAATGRGFEFRVNGGGVGNLNINSNGNVGIGNPTPGNLFSIAKSSNSGSGSTFPRMSIKNTLATQGDGSSTFNFADINISSGNDAVNMFLATTYAAGSWAPAGIINVATNHDLQIKTNNQERMRITSGGFLKASNTGAYLGAGNSYHELNSDFNTFRVVNISNTNNTSGNGAIVSSLGSNCNNTSSYHYIAGTGGADRLYIYGNGNVVNTNNSYGSLSDVKLKENIEDATPKLDDLMKVKVRNYNLIGDDKKQIGVIAQELEEVFPAMIDESEDFEEVEVPQVDEEGNEILNEEGEVQTTKEKVSTGTTNKSVKYSVFVPMLIKAMQEQQEQIKSLTEQVEALKSQING